MNVIRIEEYQPRDTVKTLRELLARAETGRLRGFAFAIKTGQLRHRYGFTGDYRANPNDLLGPAARIVYKVNQAISAMDGEPDTRTMPL